MFKSKGERAFRNSEGGIVVAEYLRCRRPNIKVSSTGEITCKCTDVRKECPKANKGTFDKDCFKEVR